MLPLSLELVVRFVVPLVALLFWGCGKSAALRNYSAALSRLEEYKDSGILLFEPRYLDAQKAAAALTGVWGIDPEVQTEANVCVANVKLYRSYVRLLQESVDEALSEHLRHREVIEKATEYDHKSRAIMIKLNQCLAKFKDRAR